MKYCVMQCVNGNFRILTEHGDLQAAVVKFHQMAAALWNAADVYTGMLKVVDENLDTVKVEYITHPVPEPEIVEEEVTPAEEPASEPTEEPEEEPAET